MNRSYSKIRHIQEANLVLENRILEEKSRQYLMEQRGSGIVYIYLPYKMVDNQKRVAQEAFLQDGYIPTYSFPLGVTEKTEKYTIKSIQTPDGKNLQPMTQKDVKGTDGYISIQGNLGGFTLPKPFNWGPQSSQGFVYFSDGQNKQYQFSFREGKQFTPAQK